VVFPEAQKLGHLHTAFLTARTPEDFARHLGDINRAARVGNHRPIVHIEAHGSDDGIALADGTELSWRDLIPLFGEINQACRMNLIVVAIVCMGWNLTAALMPSDRAPVNMVIGPVGPMRADHLLVATRKFYAALYSELDLRKALAAMNDGKPYESWLIKPGLAEILFCRVFRQYVAELCTPEMLERRQDEIVTQVIGGRIVEPGQVRHLRESVRSDLRDFRRLYDRFKHTFMMMDLFPDDSARFELTYERCFSATEGLVRGADV
jgi:hypothetical protein